MTTPETRLHRVLDRARQALQQATPKPRRPGLGDHDFSTATRRAALVPGLSTLVHPLGGRGPSDLVDPSTLETLERLQAADRELRRCGVEAVLRRIQLDGARRRAQLLGDE
ncbi:MAG: hypothetical protein KDK70_33000 [Myxococcales bacterium]|nr:hypothetical protein [Myxococcales bacterium]